MAVGKIGQLHIDFAITNRPLQVKPRFVESRMGQHRSQGLDALLCDKRSTEPDTFIRDDGRSFHAHGLSHR
jgi:hypothetical protein